MTTNFPGLVRSGGGIEWLILKYIYYTKIYAQHKMLTFEFQKLITKQYAMKINFCFYIVTFVY